MTELLRGVLNAGAGTLPVGRIEMLVSSPTSDLAMPMSTRQKNISDLWYQPTNNKS